MKRTDELLNGTVWHLLPLEGARTLNNPLEIEEGKRRTREPFLHLPESSTPLPKSQVICGGGLLLVVEQLSITCSSPFCILMIDASRVDLKGVARKKTDFLCLLSWSTFPSKAQSLIICKEWSKLPHIFLDFPRT